MKASYLIVFGVTVVVTAVVMPLMMRLAVVLGAIAHPSDRKVHAKATPSLGGGAMYIGLLAGVGCAALLGEFDAMFESPANIVGVLAAATLMFATGLVDDIRDVSPPAKVAGMVLAGGVLALAGVSIINVPLPLLGFTVLSPDLAALVTVFWVLLMANAVNLIDGLDGLAAGVMAIASGAFLLYSLKLDSEGALFDGNVGPLIAVVTLGVCVGFLFWNFYPAKIFMGDGGALLLGLLMASSSVAVGGQSDASFTGQSWFFFAPLVMPLLILAVPLLDLFFAVVRRTRSGKGFATADKDHLHHRLLRLGHGHRQTVIIMWAWTALFSFFALYPAISGRSTLIVPIAIAALLLLVFTLVFPWASRRFGRNRDGDDDLDERLDQAPAEALVPEAASRSDVAAPAASEVSIDEIDHTHVDH